MKEKILAILKPKVKAFGFNTKELEGIAESISNNLALEENASDEDVNAAIDKAINAVLPVFTQAQSMANRVIEKKAKELAAQANNNTGDENGSNGNQEPQGKGNRANGNGGNGNGADDNSGGASKGNDDNGKAIAELIAAALNPFKEKIDALSGVINAMQTEKTTTSRKQRLEKLLENSGAYGQRTLKNFAKMSFDSEDEFNEFLTDVESDLKAYNQERADAGLQQLGTPPTQNPPKTKPEVKPLSEQELKDLVESL